MSIPARIRSFQRATIIYTMAGLSCGLAGLGMATHASAQVHFAIIGASGELTGRALANELPLSGPGAVSDDCAVVPGTVFQSGVTGSGGIVHEYGLKCARVAEEIVISPANTIEWAKAEIKGRVFIDGDQSQQVSIEWHNLAFVDQGADGHVADARLRVACDIALRIDNGPPGAQVLVYYYWEAFGGASTRHECPQPFICINEEDPASTGNRLTIGRNGVGADVLAGRFNFQSPGGLAGWNQLKNQGGAMAAEVGDVIHVSLSSDGRAHIESPAPAGTQAGPEANSIFSGRLRITVGYIPPVLPPDPPAPHREFSIDIGSDSELSSSPASGNEYLDPGDCYQWAGPPVPNCGADGVRDDGLIFSGIDMPPSTPDCAPPITAAPVCGLAPAPPWTWFDLDGTDTLDHSLAPLLGPTPGPVSYFASDCIYSPEHLAISFDDDDARGYSGASCAVPTNAFSNQWGATFGKSANQDEVIYIRTFDSISSPTATVAFASGIADEVTVHPALGSNPDSFEFEDDDVDALDMVEDAAVCTVWYFSADHEAPGHDPGGVILNSGSIYEASAGGSPIEVINHAVHLGLPDGVDVRDFEFTWLYNEPVNAVWLALIFSVAPDDPGTPGDESAGLDPSRIYASFLDGVSFEYLSTPLGENIDAIATWKASLLPISNTGACCDPANGCILMSGAQCANIGGTFRGAGSDCTDLNQDGFADACECLTCRGDLNGDSIIDGGDLHMFTECFLGAAANCYCADMDANGNLDIHDVTHFVLTLLHVQVAVCP